MCTYFDSKQSICAVVGDVDLSSSVYPLSILSRLRPSLTYIQRYDIYIMLPGTIYRPLHCRHTRSSDGHQSAVADLPCTTHRISSASAAPATAIIYLVHFIRLLLLLVLLLLRPTLLLQRVCYYYYC